MRLPKRSISNQVIMNISIKICVVSFSCLILTSAFAYNTDVHSTMSLEALTASSLQTDPSLLQDLGVDSTQQFKNSDGVSHNFSQLIQDGAVFEDNLPRPINHFYNPRNQEPLTVPALPFPLDGNSTSPDWALEDNGDRSLPGYDQKFSYKDAKGYFYKAVTQKARLDRNDNFGLLFESIGHVMHHIQDMAQPQHVRNDEHLEFSWYIEGGICRLSIDWCSKYYFQIKNPSLYEALTSKMYLPLAGYAPVYPNSADLTIFNKPRKFWDNSGNQSGGDNKLRGLADFTNLNFLSAGTNFNRPDLFGLPHFDPTYKSVEKIEELCANDPTACPNSNLKGNMTFYGNDVYDANTGETKQNRRASSKSFFDADLTKKGKKSVFTLNRFNFEAAHTFLIPRAVGYSAGLINYFFRGRIDFLPDPDNPGMYIIKNLGPEDMDGTFTLYYDDNDGNRIPVSDGVWQRKILANPQGLDSINNKSDPVTFTPPTDPPPAIPGEYMLVFNGDMGQEKASNGSVGAVVAKAIEHNTGALLISTSHNGQNFSTFRSDDLGQTWIPSGGFDDLPIGGSWTGYLRAIKDKTVLSSTNLSKDSGATWSYAPSSSWRLRKNATYVGDNTTISADSNYPIQPTMAKVHFSNDNGVSWQDGPLISIASNLADFVYLGDGKVVASGTYYNGHNVPCNHPLIDIDPNCIALGQNQALIQSDDRGNSWRYVANLPAQLGFIKYLGKANPNDKGMLQADKKGTDVLFGVGWANYMYDFRRSIDGGVTWQVIPFPPEMIFSDPTYYAPWYVASNRAGQIAVYFNDGAGLNRHVMYISKDFGNTWTKGGDLPSEASPTGLWGFDFVGIPALQ
jgi:hypothetical protein